MKEDAPERNENTQQRASRGIQVRWPPSSDLDVFPANTFSVARVGHEFQLRFGYVHMTDLAELYTRTTPEGTVEPEQVASLMLSQNGFMELKQKIDEIYEGWQKKVKALERAQENKDE